MSQKANSAQQFEYKAEMKQLLNLIIHSLYTHPEVFLRELISNASDALNKARYRMLTDKNVLDADKELTIRLEVDAKAQTFSIEDSGIGMTEDDLINNIGTVARSGTLEYLQKAKADQKNAAEELIGKFGVGFYSIFMVTDEVTIETRHAGKDSKAYRWNSTGEGTYTIEEIDKADRGTKISFKLKDEYKEFSEEDKIKETVNKYSNFAEFPIFLGKDNVNTVSALWRKSEKEIKEEELKEFYKFVSHEYEDPLDHLQLSIESTAANFKALIFIPASAPFDLMRNPDRKSLHLYVNKVFIQDDCKELLPEYLRFLKGVVDTSDLPLNVSREVVQSSAVMGKIRSVLTSKVLNWLKALANKDKEKYATFSKNFGPLLKTGLNSDFTNRDKIIELLRFDSSLASIEGQTSLKEYASRMKEGQKEIYYLSGDHREALEKNPNLEYFKKKEIEVLFLTDPVDVFIVPSINEYDKKPIKSIEKGDIDLMPEDKVDKPEDNLSKDLLGVFKETLKDKVADVVPSKRLVDSAATLVSDKDGMDPQMEKMMKMMNQGGAMPAAKKVMEINTDHPLIKNLSRIYIQDAKSPMLEKCITQIYESALFIDGNLPPAADFVKRMTEIMQEATK